MKIQDAGPVKDVRKQQALRKRRLMLGSISCLFTRALVAIYWSLGYIGIDVVVIFCAEVLAINAVFFTAIATNFNLRFAAPSLTLAQISVSIMAGLYVMYYAQQSRGLILMLCISAAMFGLFKFRLREFFFMTVITVGSYAILILLVYLNRPDEITLQVAILQLFVLFATFIQFSGLGEYIGGLRYKVKEKSKELEARNGDLEKALVRIDELAMRDELTGVFNRRYLMETDRDRRPARERGDGRDLQARRRRPVSRQGAGPHPLHDRRAGNGVDRRPRQRRL